MLKIVDKERTVFTVDEDGNIVYVEDDKTNTKAEQEEKGEQDND